jgi:hypothetical protein
MLTARYDAFEVDTPDPQTDGEESGHAWTAAYVFDPGKSWTMTLEWLRVTSSSYDQSEYIGRAGPVTGTQVQLAIRYALGSSGY